MRDADRVEFLQWALPRMGFRWQGFRKVRRQVGKRIDRRLAELDLNHVSEYRQLLEHDSEEWSRLDAMCRITISRFCRDRGVFERLRTTVLPALAETAQAESRPLAAWSAGCASGEEPYSVALVWFFDLAERFRSVEISILATDADELLLGRAHRALYPASSLKELPQSWRDDAFVPRGDLYELRPRFRRPVVFEQADIRESMPHGRFDLVLCRNLAFTYFDLETQTTVLTGLAERLRPAGALVIGSHEQLPEEVGKLDRWVGSEPIFRRRPNRRA